MMTLWKSDPLTSCCTCRHFLALWIPSPAIPAAIMYPSPNFNIWGLIPPPIKKKNRGLHYSSYSNTYQLLVVPQSWISFNKYLYTGTCICISKVILFVHNGQKGFDHKRLISPLIFTTTLVYEKIIWKMDRRGAFCTVAAGL